MPLNRAHTTRPTHIMLPTYVVGYAWFGIGYALTPVALIQASPVLKYAENVMSMTAWGALFAFDAALIAAAVIVGETNPRRAWPRTAAMYALMLTFILMAIWTGIVVASTFSGVASFGSGALPFICTMACLASYYSLLRRDV